MRILPGRGVSPHNVFFKPLLEEGFGVVGQKLRQEDLYQPFLLETYISPLSGDQMIQ
jgi:hypothetical protein